MPLIYKDKVIGVLDLEHTRRGFFTEDHKRTITTLAAQVAIALENARLYEQIARQERRLERDLSLARELQFRLLPPSLPKVAHLEVAAQVRSGSRNRRRSVRLRALFAIAAGNRGRRRQRQRRSGRDLCGAGERHSALACAHRTGAGGDAVGGELLAGRASHRGAVHLPDVCRLGRRARTLQVANSGLPRPIYVHDGKIEIIEATGFRWDCSTTRTTKSSPSKPSPATCSCSSATEFSMRSNKAGEMFGRNGVERVIASCPEQSPECVVTSLFQAVEEHAAGEEAFDDQTVVAIKVKGSASKRQ